MSNPDALHKQLLHKQLASLQEPSPPGDLWARLSSAHRRRTERWRWGVGGSTLALAIVGGLSLQLSLQAPPEPRRAAAEPSVHAGDTETRLRALDRQLQAAYQANASEKHIAELWAMRRLLLAAREDQPVKPVRI